MSLSKETVETHEEPIGMLPNLKFLEDDIKDDDVESPIVDAKTSGEPSSSLADLNQHKSTNQLEVGDEINMIPMIP